MNDKPATPAQWLQQARDLIAEGQVDEALRLLRALLDNSPQLDEVIHQSARFASIRQQIRLGTLSHAEASLTHNQISHALLELLQEIEAQEREEPALQQEMKAALAKGQAQAAGQLGDKHITQHAEKIYNIDKIDNANFS